MADKDREFLDAAHHVGFVGTRKFDEILKLCAEQAKSAEQVCLERQILTQGQVDRVRKTLAQGIPAAAPPKSPTKRMTEGPHPPPTRLTQAAPARRGGMKGAVVVALLVGLAAIGYLMTRGEPAKPPAPPPVAVQPPTASKPKPDEKPAPVDPAAEREKQAEEMATLAETKYAAKEWGLALDLYQTYKEQFGDTRSFRAKTAGVSERIEVCKRNLGTGAGKPADVDRQKQDRELNVWSAEIQDLADRGDLSGALVKGFTRIAALPAGDRRKPALEALVARLEGDQRAAREWGEIQNLTLQKKWSEAFPRLKKFAADFSATAFYRTLGEFNALMQKAQLEAQAAQALAELRSAYGGMNYAEVLSKASQIDGAYVNTDTYVGARAEIGELVAVARTKTDGPGEAQARDVYKKFQDAVDKKDFPTAIALADQLMGPLSQTECFRLNSAAIRSGREAAMKGQEGDTQKTAASMLDRARKMVASGQFYDADKILKDLQEKYFSAAVVRDNLKEIRQMSVTCQTEIDKEMATIVDACEDDVARWVCPAAVKTPISLADNGKQGARCVKLEFKAGSLGGNRIQWPWVCCRLNRRAPSTVTKLTLWVRTDDAGGVNLTIDLVQPDNLNEYVFSVSRAVGPGWTQLEIPLSDFRMSWVSSQKENVKKPALSIEKVQSVGFVAGQSGKTTNIYVDWIQFKK